MVIYSSTGGTQCGRTAPHFRIAPKTSPQPTTRTNMKLKDLFLPKKAKVLPVTHRSSRQSFEVFCFFNRALTEGSDLALHPNEEMKMAKLGHGNVALFWPIFIFMYSRALQAFHDSLDIQNSEKRK